MSTDLMNVRLLLVLTRALGTFFLIEKGFNLTFTLSVTVLTGCVFVQWYSCWIFHSDALLMGVVLQCIIHT